MRKQNLFNVLASAALVVALAFGVQSCKKDDDPCDDVTCQNGGTCDEGDCSCPDGYVGSLCETEERAHYLGNWKYNESCAGSTVTDYAVTISASSSNIKKITIRGFGGFACGGSDIIVEGTIDGNDLTISSNQLFCSNQVTINSGSGTINDSGTSMSVTYTYTLAGAASQTCTGTYTKL